MSEGNFTPGEMSMCLVCNGTGTRRAECADEFVSANCEHCKGDGYAGLLRWDVLPLRTMQIGPNQREVYDIIGDHKASVAIILADQWRCNDGEFNANIIALIPAMYAYIEGRAKSGDRSAREIIKALRKLQEAA